MGLHVVESVAGDEMSSQLVATISQSSRSFDAHFRFVETLLCAVPTSRETVGDTWVGIEVEALYGVVVDEGRSSQTMETIHHEHRTGGLRLVEG